jgi:hypothetical protein
MAEPIPADPCPDGYYAVYFPDGTYVCVANANPPGGPTSPIGNPPTSTPSGPGGPGGVPPTQPTQPTPPPRTIVSPVISGRQPGAPAAPYVPPGRVGLFGGPIFNSPAPVSPVVSTSGGTGITGDLGSEGPIYVNVSNTTNLADNSASNAVQSVATAVNQGISDAANAANQVAQQTASQISTALNSTAESIQNGVNSAFTGIGDVITGVEQGINTTLGGIGGVIGQSINQALNPVSIGVSQILTQISSQIGGLAGSIGQAVAAIIPAIVAAVTGAVSPSTAVLIGIQNEIGQSINQLGQLGTDISGGLGSIDATLSRVLSGWETYNTAFVEAQTGWGLGENAHKDLSSIAAQLAGLLTSVITTGDVSLKDLLITSCPDPDLQATLNRVWTAPNGIFGLPKLIGEVLVSVLGWVFYAFHAVQKYNEVKGQDVDAKCPSGLTSHGALVDAVLRGYLTYDQAAAEAARGNINESHFHLLKDLATHQFSPGELVESLYRGIVNQDSFSALLAAQGWTGADQQVLQALAVPQFRETGSGAPNALLQRGLIDNQAYDQILKSLNFDDAQRKALAQLAFRPQDLAEAISGGAAQDEFAALGRPETEVVPEYVQVAGASEGLDHDAISRRWEAHWTDGGVQPWLNLYFRGEATLQSLQAVMDRAFVPRGLQPAIVEASRPIPQFRTLGTMYRWGILTYDGLIAQMKRHGFSDADAVLFAKFYQSEGPLPAAKRANSVHAASLSIAKSEFKDGSLSEQEYYQILLAHGFSVEGANAEIAVENAAIATSERKIRAQYVVDQYGAGLIDEKQAVAELVILGLTPVELARYEHKIRAFRVSKAKIPSETDLHGMLKAGVITPTQYVDALESQGYIEGWAQSFLAWRSAPASSQTPAPATTSAAPTGP